ncbi:MAG: hypothetical protein KO254_01525 [Methanoculleus marisnigri]|uniref:Uncharacterized protein n=1 Tax=Methanoculleus marisnigri (strain ATCC 35101 / DSM 1498 / JR1) TaxID=368407 RepID=A3CXM7_METMJ|nr:hypothetical protein [Methanoculleus marisnigri]ABN58127.1 hypothetical protein Memar_2204 [Methanoculleus marisnigri JR1]MCC7554791.1 hypothetical protein [Methanoculleus marisnigri]
MTYEKLTSRHLLAIFLVFSLALAVPAAAQETGIQQVQPGDTIEVGPEPITLDLLGLRNADSFSQITELRKYQDDNPAKSIQRVIGVAKDGYFTINVYTFKGHYGRYFPYSKSDGLLHENSIMFVHASTPTATETVATVTETPTEEPTATETPEPTRAPLPGLIAITALGICGLLAAARKR